MQKIYRILRNNKELGPFDIDELVSLQIQPTDLIWQDGKSAAWLYPSEIDSLKAIYGSVPDPASFVKTSASSGPANHQHVSEPVSIGAEEKFDAEEILTAEKLERKAEEIYKRVQAYSNTNKENDVEVKYARSLDDLKQEYADWLHKKTKKRKFIIPVPVKIIAASVVLLIAAAVFLLRDNEQPARVQTISAEKNSDQDGLSKKSNVKSPAKEKPSASSVVVQKKKSSVDEFIDSVRRVLAQQEKDRNSIPVTYYKPKYKKPVTKQEAPVRDSVIPENPGIIVEKQVDMNARYVASDNGRNLESIEVSIKNNSEEFLKAVSVDVFYYKKGDRLFDKKTLYFKNILPGNTYTLSIPANKKALEAKFKLGAVSWNN